VTDADVLRWPENKGRFRDRQNGVEVDPGELLDTDSLDADVVDHYLSRGFEVPDADGIDAAREQERPRDPEGIGDFIARVRDELPHAQQQGSTAAEFVALRDAWYFLRDVGRATPDDVTKHVWTSNDTLGRQYPNRRKVQQDVLRPFLSLLPGVIPEKGVGFRYDPDSDDDRPPAPDDPAGPDFDAVKAVIDDTVPTPNAAAHLAARNRRGVEKALAHLRTHGEATVDELKDQFSPSDAGLNTAHLYDTSHDWARECLRPAFRAMDWVDCPNVTGQPFRYVGIDSEPTAPGDTDR